LYSYYDAAWCKQYGFQVYNFDANAGFGPVDDSQVRSLQSCSDTIITTSPP
jgi:hypothetical protein